MTAVVSGESNGTVEVMPSGVEVYFQSKPKRLYRVRSPKCPDGSHNIDWQEVPSVTTVLGVLDKPALLWWSQGIGVDGTLELFRRGKLKFRDVHELSKDDVVPLLTEHRLSCNHVRDKAGDRGQAVHDALENWARHGHMPDPSIYPEEQEGYVRGLVEFLRDVPSAEPGGAEVLVVSSEHGYAGRYDLRLRTNQPHEVVVRRTATKVRRRELLPGRLLADLKTSRSAYPTHALQLEAYEQASLESGYEPTDGRGILLVSADGNYEFKRAKADIADFLAVLEVWRRFQNKKEWL